MGPRSHLCKYRHRVFRLSFCKKHWIHKVIHIQGLYLQKQNRKGYGDEIKETILFVNYVTPRDFLCTVPWSTLVTRTKIILCLIASLAAPKTIPLWPSTEHQQSQGCSHELRFSSGIKARYVCIRCTQACLSWEWVREGGRSRSKYQPFW